jgi:hypothetical protein
VRPQLAVENFDVEGSVYSADPVWDAADVVRLEVQDAAGGTLPSDHFRIGLFVRATAADRNVMGEVVAFLTGA